MARTKPGRRAEAAGALHEAARGRERRRISHPEFATLDDVVFLPANLSRLVIDPVSRRLQGADHARPGLELASPFLVAGFDEAPAEVRDAAAHGVARTGLAYVGAAARRTTFPGSSSLAGEDEPTSAAAGVIAVSPDGVCPVVPSNGARKPAARARGPRRATSARRSRSRSSTSSTCSCSRASPRIVGAWPELAGRPTCRRSATRSAILRELNREEDIALLYFGGVRSGTDVAKLIGPGRERRLSSASPSALAVGGRSTPASVAFYGDLDQEEPRRAGRALPAAPSAPRRRSCPAAPGKTDIRNLEPEDLRSISLATAEATGIPIAGRGATA